MSEAQIGRAITSSWDGHYMAPAFYSFVRYAVGNDDAVAAFRAETGNQWSPGESYLEVAIDHVTGAGRQFMQAFVDWCEQAHFGTPGDLEKAYYASHTPGLPEDKP